MDKNKNQHKDIIKQLRSKKKAAIPVILIGAGLAGLIDLVLFHLVLQSHHMVSNQIPPNMVEALKINIFGDGLFLGLSTIIIATGSVLLMRNYISSLNNKTETSAFFSSGKLFIASVLIGFGLFNVTEGIIDHHVLGIHHVIEVPDPLLWDLLFLLIGGIFPMGIGMILLARKSNFTTNSEQSKGN